MIDKSCYCDFFICLTRQTTVPVITGIAKRWFYLTLLFFCSSSFCFSSTQAAEKYQPLPTPDYETGSMRTTTRGKQYLINGQAVGKERYRAATLANEGLLLLRENKNEQAVVRLKEALTQDPTLAEAHHNLGVALIKTGNSNDAIQELSQAAKLKPQLDATRLVLASIYQSTGQLPQALATWQQFLQDFPAHPMKGRVTGMINGLQEELKNAELNRQQELALTTTAENGQTLSSSTAASRPDNKNNDDYLAEMVNRYGVKRWPASRIPIKVFISPALGLASSNARFEEILRQSFQDWSKATAGKLAFEFVPQQDTAGKHNALIECTWTENPSEVKNQAESGDTNIFEDEEGIAKSQIRFLLKSGSAGLTENQFRLTSLHEIGHALGLIGHTSNPDDIMFYSTTTKESWRELSGRDKRTITRLYAEQ